MIKRHNQFFPSTAIREEGGHQYNTTKWKHTSQKQNHCCDGGRLSTYGIREEKHATIERREPFPLTLTLMIVVIELVDAFFNLCTLRYRISK